MWTRAGPLRNWMADREESVEWENEDMEPGKRQDRWKTLPATGRTLSQISV